MANCEYAQPSTNGQFPACRTQIALRRIIDLNDLSEIYTPASLKVDMCNNDDPTAREQCPVYLDLQSHGRSSEFCK